MQPPVSDYSPRLSRIATHWSMLFAAHGESADAAAPARQALLQQYLGAVYRYLLGTVRDPELAEELSHEFVVRFLRGDFHRATPERGRFRDYVKRTLANLVNDHYRSLKRRPRPLPEALAAPPTPPEPSETSFEDCLREELIERTWSELERAGGRFHAVLATRIREPDLSSRQLAERLSQELDEALSAGTIRKTIARAREKFAEILIGQASAMLGISQIEPLRTELKNLGLLKYCRPALARRADQSQ